MCRTQIRRIGGQCAVALSCEREPLGTIVVVLDDVLNFPPVSAIKLKTSQYTWTPLGLTSTASSPIRAESSAHYPGPQQLSPMVRAHMTSRPRIDPQFGGS